jgi:hypothetical protein
MKRLLVATVIVGAFAVLPMATAGASTSTTSSFQSRIGKIYGLIPTTDVTAGGAVSNSAPASGSLYYNGGPVMTTSTVYAIYWAPSGYAFPDGYTANMNQYFKDLQATSGTNKNTYVNMTQYYSENSSGAKTYIQNKTTFAGAYADSHALPPLDPVNCPDTPVAATNGGASAPSTAAGCVTDQQVQQEISAVVKAHNWPVNNNTEFFMFTAPNIGTCFPATVGAAEGGVGTQATAPLCSFSYFCAYHSAYFDSTINPNSQIIYSNMPYAAQTNGNPVTCDLGARPNGNPSDAEMSVTSHEHNESITDPFGTGWWDSNPNDSAAGEENGDMCAWDFGNTYGASGAEYSQTINGHHYLLQTEWDNSTNGCPGSDSSGNAVPSQPNYDTPQISLTPNIGYGTAPFKILGQFFAVGDSVSSTFTDAGVTTALGSATTDLTGHFTRMTKVPANAEAGTATVTSTGSSGKASASFTVPN